MTSNIRRAVRTKGKTGAREVSSDEQAQFAPCTFGNATEMAILIATATIMGFAVIFREWSDILAVPFL